MHIQKGQNYHIYLKIFKTFSLTYTFTIFFYTPHKIHTLFANLLSLPYLLCLVHQYDQPIYTYHNVFYIHNHHKQHNLIMYHQTQLNSTNCGPLIIQAADLLQQFNKNYNKNDNLLKGWSKTMMDQTCCDYSIARC